MTDDTGTMRDAIGAAIEDYLARKGGGFLHSFVYAAEATDADGRSVMYLGGPLEQDTVRSLGLTSYLAKWFDTEARELIEQSATCSGCDDCGEDDD
jgi:hypothetical protein